MTDNDLENALKILDKELDALKAKKEKSEKNENAIKSIGKKIEGVFDKSKENELQIQLIVLQTDVQNYLGLAVALLAMMTSFIAIVASFVLVRAGNPLSYYGLLFLGVIIVFGVLGSICGIMAQCKRNELKNFLVQKK